jgi:integrase
MQPTATLYTRTDAVYSKVEFKGSKPVIDKNYTGTFYLRLSENGKRVWKPFKNIEAALTEQANMETNFDRARKGIAPLPVPSPVTPRLAAEKGTIEAAVAEFIAYSESREPDWRNGADNGLSTNSVVAYRKAMQDFAASCANFGAVRLMEFQNPDRGKAILLHFKSWLRENVTRKKGKPAHSDSRKFTVVGQFLARHGIKMKKDRRFNPNDPGLVDHKDVLKVKKPGIADVVYYTPEDIKAMLVAADNPNDKSTYLSDDLKDLVMILLCTGMRDEEVQHLEWSDINWANGDGKMKISVQDKPHHDKGGWRVKDHEKRIVSPDKNAILKARLQARQKDQGERANRNGSALLFPTHLGTCDQNFADRINSLQKRAENMKKPYVFSRPEARGHILHNFRKSYATYQMLQGVPARNIQRDLGHSELSTTERYLAIVEEPDKVRKEYAAIK